MGGWRVEGGEGWFNGESRLSTMHFLCREYVAGAVAAHRHRQGHIM